MHEEAKIDEAGYFLQQLVNSAPLDPQITGYNVSAFVSAARSVLQYARTEAQSKQGQAWYDAAVAADPVVPFFKVHRDINIHHRPVPMRTNITIHMPGPEITPPRTTSYTYEFKDWSGPEDLIGLCGRYLIRIEKIVEEGHALGLLTPDSAYSYRFWSSGK